MNHEIPEDRKALMTLRLDNENFDLQPTLKGRLIELRPLKSDDLPTLYGVASDPLIWEQHPEGDRYKEEVFSRFFREAMESRGALVAIDSRNSKLIGSSRFHGYDKERSQVEIGWTFLARAYWGGVYNGEMKELMLCHAFRFVENVIFVIGERNFRSQRAVEKLGATQAAHRPDRPGRITYRLTSSCWQHRLEAKGG